MTDHVSGNSIGCTQALLEANRDRYVCLVLPGVRWRLPVGGGRGDGAAGPGTNARFIFHAVVREYVRHVKIAACPASPGVRRPDIRSPLRVVLSHLLVCSGCR